MPKCQFSAQWMRDGWPTDMPHLKSARQSARLLALKALLDTEEGRPADAVTGIEDILALGKSTGEGPGLISGLAGVGIDSISVYWAGRFLARADVPAGDLVRLQKAFAKTATSISLRNSFAGEFVMIQGLYQRALDGRLSELGWSTGDEGESVKGPPLAFINFVLAVPLRGCVKAHQATSARFLTRLVKDGSDPAPAALMRWRTQQLGADAGQDNFVCSMLLPAVTEALQQCENAHARLRGGAACIAALRYKTETGDWPRSLEVLVPKYIDSIPADPYTGAPLIYRISDKGIVVYSVGPNGIDEGARQLTEIKPKDMDADKWWQSSDDAGFRIWK